MRVIKGQAGRRLAFPLFAVLALGLTACSQTASSADVQQDTVPLATALPPAFAETSGPSDNLSATPDLSTSSDSGETNGVVEEPLKLGYILDTTGPLAQVTAPLITAIKLAVRDINTQNIQQVKLLEPNNLASSTTGGNITGENITSSNIASTASTETSTASETLTDLISRGVDGIIGASTSALTQHVLTQVVATEVVMISPSSTDPSLSDHQDNGYHFRTVPSDSLRGRALAEIALNNLSANRPELASLPGFASLPGLASLPESANPPEVPPQNIALVFRDDDFGKSLAMAARNQLALYDIRPVEEIPLDSTAEDYYSELRTLRDSETDAVIMLTFEEGIKFLENMAETHVPGSKTLSIYLQDNLSGLSWPIGEKADGDPEGQAETRQEISQETRQETKQVEIAWQVITETGINSIQGVIYPTPESTGFQNKFRDFVASEEFTSQELECGAETPESVCDSARIFRNYVAETYDAVIIMALASLQAQSSAPSKYRTEINGVTKEGRVCRTYRTCALMILNGDDIDYEGASGSLEFSEAGEPTTGTYQIWELSVNGDYLVEPLIEISEN